MKLSIRLKYMWAAFIDVIATLFGFICKLAIPGVAVGGIVLTFNLFPWWISALICLTVALVIYLYIQAERNYKEDYETSKNVLHDKYYDFTESWFAKERGGQTYSAIYVQMTPFLDEFEALLEHHKKLYGEEDNYCKHYTEAMEHFMQIVEEHNDKK